MQQARESNLKLQERQHVRNELRAKNDATHIILIQFSLSGTQNLPIIMMNDMYFMGKYNHTKIASSYFF